MKFWISHLPLQPEELKSDLADPKAGGYVSFEGWVRNHNEGKAVRFLEYEAYEALCQKEADQILREAKERYNIVRVDCVHRVGQLKIGELAVWMGATSAHREEAFQACRYVIDQIKLRLPIWKKEHYVEGAAEWVNCQECYRHSHHYHCEKEEKEFYSRQVCISEFGDVGQKNLNKARILVVGAGGLGCPVLHTLAGAGVGHISIVDGDRLEVSNLHRQHLYSFQGVGRPKAILAEEVIKRYNPFIHVSAKSVRVDLQNAVELVQGFDVVLDCTDNFQSKYLLHDVCRMEGIPLVQASLYKYEGEVEVFMPIQTHPCLRCYAPHIPDPGCVGNCQEVGVFGYVANVVGSLQAQKAIEILLGKVPEPIKTLINLRTHEIQKIKVRKNKSCSYCGAEKMRLDRTQFEEKPFDGDLNLSEISLADYHWVDIREDEERGDVGALPLPRPPNLLHWPLSQRERFFDCSDNKKYLLVCQKGIRSARLAQELRDQNKTNFFSLSGGFEAMMENH